MTDTAIERRTSGRVEVFNSHELAAQAARIAKRAGAPSTRRTYAATYRSFCGWLGKDAPVGALTADALVAYRDHLEASDAAPATIAKQLSALRILARELGLPAEIERVKAQSVEAQPPRPLSPTEYENLLDKVSGRARRRRRGPGAKARETRDLAMVRLMGDAGLRRSEVVALTLDDFEQGGRLEDARMRKAVAHVSDWVVHVRHSKRGRNRRVPLTHEAIDAVLAWIKLRPTSAHDELFQSVPRLADDSPAPLSTATVGRMVRRYATAADVRDDRLTPHALRHTFCTELAARNVAIDVVAKLAGHADLRTTQIYIEVADDRLEEAIAALARGRTALGRAAA